jgi:putative tryptophan/tyrosine transport system substrate-binding protein
VTGVRLRAGGEPTKQLELLHELVPSATKVGLLINPANQLGVDDMATVEAAAHSMGVTVAVARASAETEFEAVITGLAQAGVQALLIDEHLYFFIRRNQLIALAMQHKIPVVSSARGWALAGSLAAYGADENEAIRQAGVYLGRVLNGESAGDLPILQPTKLSLILDLKTAKSLGLVVSPMLFARADEVIE